MDADAVAGAVLARLFWAAVERGRRAALAAEAVVCAASTDVATAGE